MPLYEGPIVDSHHHTIWSHKVNYPWMNAKMRPMIFGDDWSGMKQEYSIEQLLLDYEGHDLSQSVNVQANFDITRTSDETKGLQGFANAHGYPHGIVAHADLCDSSLEKTLLTHLNYPNTRGIRQQVYWHPTNKYWRFVDSPDFCLSNSFRRGLSTVSSYNLTFDWQGFANQFVDLSELAKSHSGLKFCLVHAGMLTDLDSVSVNEWTNELKQLVHHENIYIKVSGLNTFSRKLNEPLMKYVTDTVINMFGSDRCFYGSNFPVERMWTSLNEYISAQKRCMSTLSYEVNKKFFYDNAKQFYQI